MPTAATFNLSEIFPAVQGEGRFLGCPSFFVRSSGCNLRCQWDDTRCDTPYASWGAEERPRRLSQIKKQIEQLAVAYPHVKDVVITGGEPLLQESLPQLAADLRRRGFRVTVETNGTIARELSVDFVSISPKLASSTPSGCEFTRLHETNRINLDSLRFWSENYDHQFKFVIHCDADEEEVVSILEQLGAVCPSRVYVMPQGTSMALLVPRAKKCIAMALRHGWRYTPRAHIEIFGNTRGT